jgi:hypothetical protein
MPEQGAGSAGGADGGNNDAGAGNAGGENDRRDADRTDDRREADRGREDERLGEAGIRALRAEREAREAAETERAELAAKLKEIEDRDKSESERLAERVRELEESNGKLESELSTVRLGRHLERAADKAGARYADAVTKLIDAADVKLDRHGEPTNLEELMSDVRDRYPELFRSRSGRGDANAGGRGEAAGGSDDDGSMSARIRQAAGRR